VRQQLTAPDKMAKWLESGARWRSELPNANGGSDANGATSVANSAQVKAHE
jgi:hypothetical protein